MRSTTPGRCAKWLPSVCPAFDGTLRSRSNLHRPKEIPRRGFRESGDESLVLFERGGRRSARHDHPRANIGFLEWPSNLHNHLASEIQSIETLFRLLACTRDPPAAA